MTQCNTLIEFVTYEIGPPYYLKLMTEHSYKIELHLGEAFLISLKLLNIEYRSIARSGTNVK